LGAKSGAKMAGYHAYSTPTPKYHNMTSEDYVACSILLHNKAGDSLPGYCDGHAKFLARKSPLSSKNWENSSYKGHCRDNGDFLAST